MIYFTLFLVLCSLSGLFMAVMDKLQFHYDKSVFKDIKPNFLNPQISHKNKWMFGVPAGGDKFWLSSTLLVFLTDGWHLAKFMFLNCVTLAFYFALILGFHLHVFSVLKFLLVVIAGRIIMSATFHIFFTYILDSEFYNKKN